MLVGRDRIRLLVALLLFATAASSATSAEAQRGRRAASENTEEGDETVTPPTLADLDELVEQLNSSDDDQARAAVDMLVMMDRPEVIAPLARMLRGGRSDAVTDQALMGLRGLAKPSAIDVLVEFTRHRRPRARRLAYQALAAIESPRVTSLLEQGLRDSDRAIRASCARSLGNIGNARSVPTLFVAFDRGVVEAAAAIGKLAPAGQVERFDAYLGQRPLSVMLSGYHEFVRRRDVPEATKIAIINRLGEVSGPFVRSFLQRYLDTFPSRGRNRLRDVVIDTLRRIPGAASRQSAEGAAQ